jgi:hypothetical protein
MGMGLGERPPVGTRVHVEFDGVVHKGYGDVHPLHVAVSDGGSLHHLHLMSDNVTVIPPADWPPQIGDIWEADGHEYYVRQHCFDTERYAVEGFNQETGSYSDDLDDFKALNPVLIRRRGQ